MILVYYGINVSFVWINFSKIPTQNLNFPRSVCILITSYIIDYNNPVVFPSIAGKHIKFGYTGRHATILIKSRKIISEKFQIFKTALLGKFQNQPFKIHNLRNNFPL